MNVAQQIRSKILNFPEDRVFGYSDLGISRENYLSSAKAIERIQKEGLIKKLSKGVFYKPVITIFGELRPTDSEQLKLYLFRNGKRVAYVTGESLYNQLGLTTQMAFRIKIATQRRIKIDKGTLNVRSVKSYTEVTNDNFRILGILDVLKDIKRIPDCSVSEAVNRLKHILMEFEEDQLNEMIKYAKLYPPRVRALLGALLENYNSKLDVSELKKSLNPLTQFDFNLKLTDLPTINNWQIK